MMYEFTRGKLTARGGSPQGPGRNKSLQSTEELKLVEVKDKSIADSWTCDPHLFQYDELHTLFVCIQKHWRL
jgi:hypothetical protein